MHLAFPSSHISGGFGLWCWFCWRRFLFYNLRPPQMKLSVLRLCKYWAIAYTDICHRFDAFIEYQDSPGWNILASQNVRNMTKIQIWGELHVSGASEEALNIPVWQFSWRGQLDTFPPSCSRSSLPSLNPTLDRLTIIGERATGNNRPTPLSPIIMYPCDTVFSFALVQQLSGKLNMFIEILFGQTIHRQKRQSFL